MIEDQVTHNLKPHWAKSLGSSLAGCMPCAPHLGFGETKVNAYMVVGCALDSIDLCRVMELCTYFIQTTNRGRVGL